MKYKELTANTIINVACKPISGIVNLVYIKYVLDYLGVEQYGVWATILTILSWIEFLDMGIGNGLRNRLVESLESDNKNGKALVSSAYAILILMMFVISILSMIIASQIGWESIIKTDSIYERIDIVIKLGIVFTAWNMVFSVIRSVLYAIQKTAIVGILQLLVQVINLICVLMAGRYSSGNLYIVIVAYELSIFIVNFCASVIVYGKHEEIRPSRRQISCKKGVELVRLGSLFFIVQLCSLIVFSTDNILVSLMFGVKNVTPYTMVHNIYGVLISLFSAALMPMWSMVTKIKSQKRYGVLQIMFKRIYAMLIPFILGAIVVAFLFDRISYLWLGRELAYSSELIIAGCLFCALSIWSNAHGTVANGLGILKGQMLMAIIQAIINVPLSILFAITLKMGVCGVLLGTDITLLVSCFYLPYYINKWKVQVINNAN